MAATKRPKLLTTRKDIWFTESEIALMQRLGPKIKMKKRSVLGTKFFSANEVVRKCIHIVAEFYGLEPSTTQQEVSNAGSTGSKLDRSTASHKAGLRGSTKESIGA